MKRIYGTFEKTEPQPDGTIKVYGYASSGSVDSDGETIQPSAIKAAIPEYMKFGAVREMHDAKKAAGTAIEIDVLDDGRTHFAAHVVDPVAVLKVQTGVYKGFSIGGSIPKDGRNPLKKSDIIAINLREVSLVDRPANPDAVFSMFKAEGAMEGEEADEGTTPDPIAQPDTASPSGDGSEPATKGLYTAQRLIDALGTVRDCCSTIEWETTNGDHTAKTLTMAKEMLTSLGAFAQKYLGEELSLMNGTKAKADSPAIGDVAKALDLPETATLEEVTAQIGTLRKSVADASAAEELAKADNATCAEIAKAAGIEVDEGATGPLALLSASLQKTIKLNAELAVMKGRAAPPRAFANGQGISKAADGADIADNPEVPVVKRGDGEVDEVATLVKAAQRQPIQMFN